MVNGWRRCVNCSPTVISSLAPWARDEPMRVDTSTLGGQAPHRPRIVFVLDFDYRCKVVPGVREAAPLMIKHVTHHGYGRFGSQGGQIVILAHPDQVEDMTFWRAGIEYAAGKTPGLTSCRLRPHTPTIKT